MTVAFYNIADKLDRHGPTRLWTKVELSMKLCLTDIERDDAADSDKFHFVMMLKLRWDNRFIKLFTACIIILI